MQFRNFAKYLQKLEETSKRLEITDILTSLLNELDNDETDLSVYLALGELQAPYKNKKFNIADKMILRALEQAFHKSPDVLMKLYSEKGDLGGVVESIVGENSHKGLNIPDTYKKLWEIADSDGAGSQDLKIAKTAELLQSVDALSAKYVVRIILGTMRLGFTELTVLDALVQYVGKTDKDAKKTFKAKLEEIYNLHPDIGLIAKKIKELGDTGVDKIGIEVGVPILPQKCQRIPTFEEIIEKMECVWAEYKFDGTRVQLHMDKSKKLETTELEQKNLFADETPERIFVKTFTRNLEEVTYQYPDIVEAALNQIEATSVIIDGEAVGYDPDTMEFLPFQQIMQRKRKHNVKEMAEKIPLKYFVFDLLYLNGKSLTTEPLTKRKELLKKVVKKGDVILVDDYPEIKTVDGLKAYFAEAREKGLEGLILKKPDVGYQAGARSFNWVKIKVADTKLLDDSVDVVVLGYYFGKGVRSKFGIGGFLVGIFDPDEGVYKTITKVGTGLKDEDWITLKQKADKVAVKEQPKNYVVNKIYKPDVWTAPEIVVELGADEVSVSQTHSLGYALRFPRLLKFRDDKRASDTTTPQEIVDLLNMQKRGNYQ